MNQNIKIGISIALIIIAIVSAIGMAKHHAHRRTMVNLKLNTEQQAKMQDFQMRQITASKSKMEAIRTYHQILDCEFLKENPNETVILNTINQIKATQAELMTLHFNGLLEMRKILSPAQFRQMVSERQRFIRRMEQHRSRHGRPEGGPGGRMMEQNMVMPLGMPPHVPGTKPPHPEQCKPESGNAHPAAQ